MIYITSFSCCFTAARKWDRTPCAKGSKVYDKHCPSQIEDSRSYTHTHTHTHKHMHAHHTHYTQTETKKDNNYTFYSLHGLMCKERKEGRKRKGRKSYKYSQTAKGSQQEVANIRQYIQLSPPSHPSQGT